MDNWDKLFLTITQKGWVEFDQISKNFKSSPVAQENIRKQNYEQLGRHCQELIDNLAAKLDYELQTGSLTEVTYDKGVIFVQYAEMVCQYLYPLSTLTILLEGTFYLNHGNLAKALQYFEDDLKLTKELYEANPQNVGFKNGLAISYAKLGAFYMDKQDELNSAESYFRKAKLLWDELTNDFPDYVEFQNNLMYISGKLDTLQAEIHQNELNKC